MKISSEQVVDAEILGARFRFCVADAMDTVQRHHYAGEFYELEELQIISKYFRSGGSFLDVGANVGNHAVFAAKILNASRLILVEPNPEALAILARNLALNGLDAETTAIHRCALSDRRGLGRIIPRYQHNLGATQVIRLNDGKVEAGGVAVPCVVGDELVASEAVDFIKIDVEGQAIDVLRGLRATIAANRPPIFVEIDDAVQLEFEGWLVGNRYTIAERFIRYATQANYMILPLERSRVQGAREAVGLVPTRQS